MIEGVKLRQLNTFPDERGCVLHFLKASSPEFQSFGEAYFSITNPSVIKAWKWHKGKSQNLVVVSGEVKFVIYDNRENSSTHGIVNEYKLSRQDYKLLTLPESIWYGFQTISNTESIISNISNIEFGASESKTLDIQTEEIPYRWT